MDMTDYQSWEHDKLNSIHQDIEALEKMTGSEKMGESFDSGLLAGMLQKQGVDPNLLALMNDGDGLGGGNGLWVLLLFLLILGRGGLGFGGGDNVAKESTVIDQSNYASLMNAITSTGARQEVAIGDLATSLGCSIGDIKMALAGVDKSIALANGSIINAVQSVDASLGSKIVDCCCRTNLNIERSQNAIQNQISAQTNGMNLSFSAQNQLIQQQTQQILGQMNANMVAVNDQFCQIRQREDMREIQSLRDRLAEQRDTANTLSILNAIQNKDTIAYTGTISGSTVSGTGSLS